MAIIQFGGNALSFGGNSIAFGGGPSMAAVINSDSFTSTDGATSTTTASFTPGAGTKCILLFCGRDNNTTTGGTFDSATFGGASMTLLARTNNSLRVQGNTSAVFAIHDPDLSAGTFVIGHTANGVARAFLAVAVSGYIQSVTMHGNDAMRVPVISEIGVLDDADNSLGLSFLTHRTSQATSITGGSSVVSDSVSSAMVNEVAQHTSLSAGQNIMDFGNGTDGQGAVYDVLVRTTAAGAGGGGRRRQIDPKHLGVV